MKGRILVVDDDGNMRDLLQRYLTDHGYTVTPKPSGDEALRELEHVEYDLVLTDLRMAGLNGIELCDRIVVNYPHLPVILLTAFGSLPAAIEAIRAGAYDFVTKPVDLKALLGTIERALTKSLVRQLGDKLPETDVTQAVAAELAGDAIAIQAARKVISQVTHIDTPVLIVGEQGTGKGLVARMLHKGGTRSGGPYVSLNCATNSESQIELELFGSRSPSDGLDPDCAFTRADGGTLVLNEIGALSPVIQTRLLQTLRDGFPIKSSSEIGATSNFRLVATTTKDLDEEARLGAFNSGLLSHITIIRIPLPPLRERGSDILLLARQSIKTTAARLNKKVVGLTQAVAERVLLYSWPGNVEELNSAMERAVALATYEYVRVEDLPEAMRAYKNVPQFDDETPSNQLVPLDQVEQRHIYRVLKELGGNKAMAARVLGLDRRTLYRKLEQYGYQNKD